MNTATDVPTVDEIAAAIDWPTGTWNARCHEVSLAAVRSGIFGEPGPTCRVVRGFAAGLGIFGQHSWIALGTPYDPACTYIDPTAWTWENDFDGLHVTTAADEWLRMMAVSKGHVIHAYDQRNIMAVGRPAPPSHPAETVLLDRDGLSDEACWFLDLLGPLDAYGWARLCEFPQGGWPYREIVTRIVETVPRAKSLVPIDVQGMATDANPGGLYW